MTQGKTKALRPPRQSLSPHPLIWVLKVIYSNIRGEALKVHLADKDAIADRNVEPEAKLQLSSHTQICGQFFFPPPPLSLCWFSVGSPPNSIFPSCLLSSHLQLLVSHPHSTPLLICFLTSAYTSPSLFPPYQLLLVSFVPSSF